jgi:hypothetical protein
MKKYLFYLLLGLITAIFSGNVISHKDDYLRRYDPNYWQTRYENSNWAKGWEAGETMGDPELYAYAGWRQVQGDDPTKINAEMPPFGKYLIGFSILIFQNQNIPAIFFGVALLVVIFLISKEILKDKVWALVPVFFFSIEKLFLEDLATSMLDLPFTFFACLALLFLIKGRKNPRLYLGVTIALACVATTKMYLVGFALMALVAAYLLFLLIVFRNKDFFWFLLFSPLFLVLYCSTYLVYFIDGHNLIDFKELHFWIRHFARVQMPGYPQFEIWRILLLGQWHTWWGEGIIHIKQWTPLWLISFLSIFPTFWFIFKKGIKKNLSLLLLIAFPLSLLAMYSYGLPYPRYLMPVLPPLYILLCYNLRKAKISSFAYNLKLAFEKWKK